MIVNRLARPLRNARSGRDLVVGLALLAALAVPSVASAQLIRNGNSIGLLDVLTWGSDTCYDPVHQVYFVVGGQGALYGMFATTTGAPASTFIHFGNTSGASDPTYGLFPRCAYSPDVNNGTGGFIVTWLQSLPTTVHAVIVGDPNGATDTPPISAESFVTVTANAHSAIGGPAVAYSKISKKFLVVWPTSSTGVNARLVDLNGAGEGAVLTVHTPTSVTGAIFPAVTWNSQTDEFGVAYSRFNDATKVGLIILRRIALNGSMSAEHNIWSGNGFSPELAYNPSTRRYFVGWSTAPGSLGAEVDESGTVVRQGLISSRVGSPQNFGVAYNPVSGTFAAISEDNFPTAPFDVAGLELNKNGIALETAKPVTNGGGSKGSFWPRITARTDAKEWSISYARQFLSLANQIVSTNSAEAGPVSTIQIAIDSPTAGGIFRPTDPITVSGWVLDRGASSGIGIDAVHVYAFPTGGAPSVFMGDVTSFAPRVDVGGLLGAQFTNSGLSVSANLPAGTYTINVYAHSTVTGTWGPAKSVAVTVTSSLPLMSLDTPRTNTTVGTTFSVSGWALDKFAGAGTGVAAIHVWAFPAGGSPIFVGEAQLGGGRTDVGAVFGAQFDNSGYNLVGTLPAGSYQLVAYMYSAVSNSWALSQSAAITVAAPQSLPLGFVDNPVSGVINVPIGSAISGWAIDRGSSVGTGVDLVHVWSFPVSGAAPVFVGAATLGGSRGDIGTIFGSQFNNAGFSLSMPLLGLPIPQAVDLVIYMHSAISGQWTEIKRLRITAQ